MKVTMDKIAKRAGLSRPVVSSVLNGGVANIRYSERTRSRVLKAAAEINYLPRSTQVIAIVHSVGANRRPCETGWANSVGPLLIGMHEAALEHNKIVATFAYSNEEMASKFSHRRVPAVFLRSNVEGMLLSGSMDEQLMNRVNEVRLPHVFMNVNDAHRQPCDSISFNEDHCGRLATEHLLHLGHRNLVHVSLDNPDGGRHYSTRHRRRAFESTVSDAGVRGRVVFYDRNADDPLAHLRAILKDADRPTAIFAYNNQLTLATYRVLSELGLSCRDVGLVGVQWQSEYEVQELRINHVALPAPEMGKLAFEALMRKISGEKDLPAIELRGTLVESASVFPVSSP